MVINLDTSDGNGTHWVSLYINLKKRQLYFFDSYGKKPMKSIFNFMNRIYNEFTNRNLDYNVVHTNKKFKVRYNTIQHQRKNSECGVYSMNFIIRLLNGEKFSDITKILLMMIKCSNAENHILDNYILSIKFKILFNFCVVIFIVFIIFIIIFNIIFV